MEENPRRLEPGRIDSAKTSARFAPVYAVVRRVSTLFHSDSSRRERLAVGLSLVLLALVAVALLAHLTWSYRHMRPNVQLTNDLRVLTNSPTAAAAGLVGYRITAANGRPVATLAQFNEVVGAGSRRVLLTEAVPVDGGNTRLTFWRESRVARRFDLDADGVILRVEPPLNGAPDVVGARLIAIGGTPLPAVADPARALRRNQSTLRLTLALSDTAESMMDLVIVRLDWRVQYALFLIGVVFGALGFAVYRLKPNSRSSWGFLAFCVVVATFWMIRSVPEFYRVPVESRGFYLLQCALPLATMGFLGTFSPLRVVLTPLRPWLLAAAALGLMLLTVNQIAYPQDAAAGLLSLPLLVGLSAMMLTIMLLSQPTRLWFYLRGLPIGQTDRARATSLRFAVLLGFVPLAVFYPAVVAERIDFSQRLWFELAVLAFPLIVAYAIVRHNLLQLNELAREGFAIGLLVLSLGLAYAVVAALVGPLAQRVLGEASGALPQSIAVGAFAFVLMPLYAATRRRLLHRYHRADSFDEYLQMLSTLSDRQRNLDTFCDEVVLIASAALNGTSVALLLRQKSPAGEWRLAASTADTALSVDLERFRPILESLRQTSVTLDQNEILEGRPYRLQRGTLLKAWSDLNASMVVPLHGGDNRLAAALVLGRKPAGATFTAPELRFIEALHARLAAGLARWFTEADEGATATAAYPAYPPTIGRYRLDRLLGEGATCYVYLAFDGGREVAIKVPKPITLSSDTLLARFLRESRTMRRVVHPHIVRVLDEGTARGEPFIVVEYFPEGAFNRYLKRVGSIDEARALGLVRDLASGLEAALEHDIIHRDIKPANFFLATGEQVKIGDFGLAKGADDTTLTVLGAFLGTPAYVSPEVANGLEASWRSDQYSLGICLFEMLAGERPFQSASIDDLLHLHRTEPIPDLCQRCGVSSSTQGVLRRMTEKGPADRFQSYAQLRDALQVAIGSQDLVA